VRKESRVGRPKKRNPKLIHRKETPTQRQAYKMTSESINPQMCFEVSHLFAYRKNNSVRGQPRDATGKRHPNRVDPRVLAPLRLVLAPSSGTPSPPNVTSRTCTQEYFLLQRTSDPLRLTRHVILPPSKTGAGMNSRKCIPHLRSRSATRPRPFADSLFWPQKGSYATIALSSHLIISRVHYCKYRTSFRAV
jgi:hypothetical protein